MLRFLRFFTQPFIKIILGTDSRGAGRSFFEYVLQFVVYPTGFLVVSELDMEHFDQTGAQVRVEDGGDGFDTAVEVAGASSRASPCIFWGALRCRNTRCGRAPENCRQCG